MQETQRGCECIPLGEDALNRPSGLLVFSLFVYGCLNVALYSALLPLWEGFDEPFHYGYVEFLSTRSGIPNADYCPLSREIEVSLRYAPASHIVRRNLGEGITTFDEYFKLSLPERHAKRAALEQIDPALRYAASNVYSNYEAHQAPLAYLFLSSLDRLLEPLPLVTRVITLRIVAGIVSVGLLAMAMIIFCNQLAVPPPFTIGAVFSALSCQMLYATVCHVANDWLALPFVILFIALLARLWQKPGLITALGVGVSLAAGLLTKAYFLAFVPIVVVFFVWALVTRRMQPKHILLSIACTLCGAPWYVRNWLLHKNLSGMNEGGISLQQVARAVSEIEWLDTLAFVARGALWTGNNSFTTFSRDTLNICLAVIAVGFLCYIVRSGCRAVNGTMLWVVICLAAFGFAVLYASSLSYVYTNAASRGASPWYAQPLLPPVLCLAAAGYARAGRLGHGIWAAYVALQAYVINATYAAKLIPQYGGYAGERARLPELARWYFEKSRQIHGVLSDTCLGGGAAVWVLYACVAICSSVLCTITCRELMRRRGGCASPEVKSATARFTLSS